MRKRIVPLFEMSVSDDELKALFRAAESHRDDILAALEGRTELKAWGTCGHCTESRMHRLTEVLSLRLAAHTHRVAH